MSVNPEPGWNLLTSTGELLQPGVRVSPTDAVYERGDRALCRGTVTFVAVSVKWDSGVTERMNPNELEVVED